MHISRIPMSHEATVETLLAMEPGIEESSGRTVASACRSSGRHLLHLQLRHDGDQGKNEFLPRYGEGNRKPNRRPL